jgi:hypothetical protein
MIGMLSKNEIALLHLGQWEGGRKIDSRLGIRAMHTFRKLPTIAPKRKTTVAVKAAESLNVSVIMFVFVSGTCRPYDAIQNGRSLLS